MLERSCSSTSTLHRWLDSTRMRMHLSILLALLLALLFPPSAAIGEDAPSPGFTDRIVENAARQVQGYEAHGELGPGLDIPKVLAELRHRILSGTSQIDALTWLSTELKASFLSFAPVGATSDPQVLYRFPFDPGTPRLVVQGPGDGDHLGVQFYAFDFVMPVGTPVLAARAGTVARVTHGYTEGGLRDALKHRANVVFVLHTDGTFAEYVHL